MIVQKIRKKLVRLKWIFLLMDRMMNLFHSLIYFLSNFLRNKLTICFTCSTIIGFCNPNQIWNSSNRNPQDPTRMAYQLILFFSIGVGTLISIFFHEKTWSYNFEVETTKCNIYLYSFLFIGLKAFFAILDPINLKSFELKSAKKNFIM